MNVSQNHHRISGPSEERRVALEWLVRQVRWERLLEQARGEKAE